MFTIESYEKTIAQYTKEIEENRNNPCFYEPTPIVGMHDTGNSRYESALAMIRYCKSEIERIKEREEKAKEAERKMALKAEKAGMTLEAYKAEKEAKAKAKALKAKAKRYRAELEELNERKAYLEKWLAENEGV